MRSYCHLCMRSNINWSHQCFTTNVSSFIFYLQAQSTSLGFTSLLDNGLNYCNLYKLLSGQFFFLNMNYFLFFLSEVEIHGGCPAFPRGGRG